MRARPADFARWARRGIEGWSWEEVLPAYKAMENTPTGDDVCHAAAARCRSGTAAAYDNAHYKQQFGVDNPNLEIIRKLRAAGTDVAVCGQAMAKHHFQYEWIAPNVTLALSAMTTITVLENEGYALMPV